MLCEAWLKSFTCYNTYEKTLSTFLKWRITFPSVCQTTILKNPFHPIQNLDYRAKDTPSIHYVRNIKGDIVFRLLCTPACCSSQTPKSFSFTLPQSDTESSIQIAFMIQQEEQCNATAMVHCLFNKYSTVLMSF